VLGTGWFKINYTAPSIEGNYFAIVTITNNPPSSSPPQLNVSINMTVTKVNVTILYPVENVTNVTAGNTIEAHVNTSYQGVVISSNVSWNLTIGGSYCNTTSNYINNYWNLTCSAPSLADGIGYDLTAIFVHATYGLITETASKIINYRDITPPWFNVTRNNINKGNNISLQANVTDNIAVDKVWFVLTYPNSSVYNLSNSTDIFMSTSNGLYVFTGLNLTDAGEYSVNYSANDTTGNFNSTSDWFEVYDRYLWNVKLSDYSSAAVAGVNISLNRPNSTTVFLSNVSDSSGIASFLVNRRFYDIHAFISGDEIIIRNVNFNNISAIGVSLNF
jgi:hypothetical protein